MTAGRRAAYSRWMRVLLILGCVAALLAPVAAASSSTVLTITYRDDPGQQSATRWTLRCGPVGGSHPRRVAACRELAKLGWQAFKPLPKDTACAELYGGPQLAVVRGRIDGRAIWVKLTRVDGCQIERWGRVPSLLPAGGA